MNKDIFKYPIRHFIQHKINSGAILLFVAHHCNDYCQFSFPGTL